MKDIRGSTFIEIILIISIISILILIPLIRGGVFKSYKEREELKEFIKDLNYARIRAIVESTRYSVNLKYGDNSYTIIKHTNPKEIIKRKEFTNGIRIRNSSIINNEIEFTPAGTPRDSKTIYLEDRNRNLIKITIRVATGKISVYFD
ncbi:MAG: hypothetical protein GXY88_03880 [Tissierellia bacterium]|nr:hypothetical protein [Tissierellia bacterium]